MPKFTRLQIALIIAIVLFICSCSTNRTLHEGRYTYKQLVARGYDCKPFTGVKYIRVTKDTNLVNIKPVTHAKDTTTAR